MSMGECHMDKNEELDSELAFMEVMRRYRAVKESGDPEAIRIAEEELREHVRGEFVRNSEQE